MRHLSKYIFIAVMLTLFLIMLNNAPLSRAEASPPVGTPIGGGQGKIVFHWRPASGGYTDYNIYSVETSGSNKRSLTTSGYDHFPVVSPDGKSIAFESERNGNTQIFIINSDGSNERLLTSSKGINISPTWSPDSKQIAFSANRSSPHVKDDYNIYVINADASNERQISDGQHDYYPFWSPNGKHIAFTSLSDSESALYVMNADGSDLRRLAQTLDIANAVWSPDSKQIIFCAEKSPTIDHTISIEDRNRNIYSIDVDGVNLRRLTVNHGFHGDPAISPNGKQIAFSSYEDGQDTSFSIYLMNSNGSNLHRLTSNINDEEPKWSPDGKYIAFMTNTSTSTRGDSWKIYIIGADGSNQKYLADIADDGIFDWIP